MARWDTATCWTSLAQFGLHVKTWWKCFPLWQAWWEKNKKMVCSQQNHHHFNVKLVLHKSNSAQTRARERSSEREQKDFGRSADWLILEGGARPYLSLHATPVSLQYRMQLKNVRPRLHLCIINCSVPPQSLSAIQCRFFFFFWSKRWAISVEWGESGAEWLWTGEKAERRVPWAWARTHPYFWSHPLRQTFCCRIHNFSYNVQ